MKHWFSSMSKTSIKRKRRFIAKHFCLTKMRAVFENKTSLSSTSEIVNGKRLHGYESMNAYLFKKSEASM